MKNFLIKLAIICLLMNINNAYAYTENVWCGQSTRANVSLERGGLVFQPAIFIKKGDIAVGGSRQFCGNGDDTPVALHFTNDNAEKKWEDCCGYSGMRGYAEQIKVKGEIKSGRIGGYEAYWIDDPEIIEVGY